MGTGFSQLVQILDHYSKADRLRVVETLKARGFSFEIH